MAQSRGLAARVPNGHRRRGVALARLRVRITPARRGTGVPAAPGDAPGAAGRRRGHAVHAGRRRGHARGRGGSGCQDPGLDPAPGVLPWWCAPDPPPSAAAVALLRCRRRQGRALPAFCAPPPPPTLPPTTRPTVLSFSPSTLPPLPALQPSKRGRAAAGLRPRSGHARRHAAPPVLIGHASSRPPY